jgi:copper chaperone CopZ
MSQMTLYVGGMGCRRCVREVTARLRDVLGVETVAADFGTSTVRLGGAMAVEDVLRAFVGTTYRPEVVANSDGTATGQPAP